MSRRVRKRKKEDSRVRDRDEKRSDRRTGRRSRRRDDRRSDEKSDRRRREDRGRKGGQRREDKGDDRKRRGEKRDDRRRRRRSKKYSSEEEDSYDSYDDDDDSEEGEEEGEGGETSEEELTQEERQIKKFVGGVKMEHLTVFNDSIQEYRQTQRFDDGFLGKMNHDLRTVLNMNREIPEDLMSTLCPGFIFIGMESSGKSSVVCGVVGEPLCDINQGVCTRVPSYITVESDRKKADTVATVMVKHHGGVKKIQNYIKRAHSDCKRTDGRLNIWEGWTVNKKINELIGGRGSAKDPGADQEPIHFNIKTPEDIFPFFLIDMPGYVGANAGRTFSDKVEEINHDTIQKYVIDPIDSRMYVCVCVEAAQCMSIRRDKFTRIIGMEEETKRCDRIIFIFTKCDLFFQTEDIATFLERFAEKGIETSHRGLWDYFTKDILKLYPNAEFFFSACPVLEGVYKKKLNQTRKYREAKARIQGELRREGTSRYHSIVSFLRGLHKMKWRNKMEFRKDPEYLKKFECRLGLHRLQRMIQLKSRLNDGVKIGEFVHKIMDGKHTDWKNLYDAAKVKLDLEKTNPSPAAETLGVLKDTKKVLYHLFTGRFLKGEKIVKPENDEDMFNSLFLKEFMGSKETLIDMVRIPFPQIKKRNLKVFEKRIQDNLQDDRCGSLICIGDAITLLLCCIPMEKPLYTNVRELNQNTTHDFDSDSRSVRNYFLHRIREFSTRICGKSFEFIKKIWKLYLKRIYSSLDSMIERHLKKTIHERWKRGDKMTMLRKDIIAYSKFAVTQSLDINKMLDLRLKHFENQYLMVPTTYAQTYESFVNIGHRHYRIGGDYEKLQRLMKKQRRKERALRRENLALKRRIVGKELPELQERDEKETKKFDAKLKAIGLEFSDDEEEEMAKKKREEEQVDLGEEIDGVIHFKSGEMVYKYGTPKAGKYEVMGGQPQSQNFVDIHGGKYLPQMNMYLKSDRTALQDGEFGKLEDGKFYDVHGGWYEILPNGPHPPLNFGDYHIFPKKEEEPEVEEEEHEGEEEEEEDPVQFAVMDMVYRSFHVDGLFKHITGNKITKEEVVNFNNDLERVCHVISVNLANQVYLFQAEMKNLFRPENYGRELDFGFEMFRKYLISKLEEKSSVYYFDHMSLDDLIIERFGLESELKRYQEDVNLYNECVVQIGEVNNLVQKYLIEARHLKQNTSAIDPNNRRDLMEEDYDEQIENEGYSGDDDDEELMNPQQQNPIYSEEENTDNIEIMIQQHNDDDDEEEPIMEEEEEVLFQKKKQEEAKRRASFNNNNGRSSSNGNGRNFLQEAREKRKKERQSSRVNTPKNSNQQRRASRSPSSSSGRNGGQQQQQQQRRGSSSRRRNLNVPSSLPQQQQPNGRGRTHSSSRRSGGSTNNNNNNNRLNDIRNDVRRRTKSSQDIRRRGGNNNNNNNSSFSKRELFKENTNSSSSSTKKSRNVDSFSDGTDSEDMGYTDNRNNNFGDGFPSMEEGTLDDEIGDISGIGDEIDY